MKPVPIVSDRDIAAAFRDGEPTRSERRIAEHADKLKLLTPFKDSWQKNLGSLFECPCDAQLFMWRKMAGFDAEILEQCTLDLRRRAQQGKFNALDPYEHALRHFSAKLIYLTRGKYVRVRPTIERAA
jgi:hypothetical protein